MLKVWRRYAAVIRTPAFVITVATGLFTLIGALLSISGVTPLVPRIFALAAVAVGGLTIAIGAVRGLLRRQINVDELVTIAIVASVIYGEYLSAAFVAFMMLFGKILEDFTAERARTALEELGKLVPPKATVRRNGQDTEVLVSDIVPGDLVISKPGERIAVDGLVVSGQASVNQATITGESMPVAKSKGSEVYAGTLNELGSLEIRTTRVGDTTTLGQVMHLVEEAEVNRAPIVRTADRYAKYFTPAILVIAALVYLLSGNINHALSTLIVACPCALVLATPIAIVAGVANGARRGILIRGGARLEAAGRVTAIALDKTGTITMGKPEVMKVIPFGDNSEESILKSAAACERLSEHSLAKAILEKAKHLNLDIPVANEFKAIPGQGVSCTIDDSLILIGTENLLNSHEITLSASEMSVLQEMERDGLTPILVACSCRVAGMIGIADTVREDMRESIQSLKNGGVKKVVMLTGDSQEVARRVADAVGIDEWQARLLPQQKVEAIQQLQHEGYKVAMIGDGINDAPALAQADVGIAMGVRGTDIAMEASNVVLLKDDILSAAESIRLSQLTLQTINRNLIFALVFNAL